MKKLILIQTGLALFFALPAYSQSDTIADPFEVVDTLNQDFGLFSKEDVLNLSLRFDITHYTRKKPKDEYMNAILTYHINKTDSINKEVRLKSRGEMRNGHCDFPPIRLNFKKTEFPNAPDLDKIEKLKLVTHCEYGNEENLLKEYLIYKLYNVLTDTSFRVRLVRIEYINTYKKRKPINTYGFFIEPIEILAERVNAIAVNSLTLTQKDIIPQMMTRMAIFNYMIGNTDWTVTYQHNIKVLIGSSSDKPGLGIAVPYDFDYSGLVDTHYAIPAEALGLSSVRERRYLGLCRTEDDFLRALMEFSDKKTEFYRLINEFPWLNEKAKKSMTGYLDEFFNGVDKRNTVIQNFMNECDNF